MSSGTPSAPPAPPSGTGTGTGGSGGGGSSSSSNPVSAARIKMAAASILYMPSGTKLEVLSGHNWSSWSGVFTALLQLNDVDAILTHDTLPSGVDADISVLTGCLTHLGPAGASWGQLVPAGASWYNTLKLASCHVHRPCPNPLQSPHRVMTSK